jgi:hypothetical protein
MEKQHDWTEPTPTSVRRERAIEEQGGRRIPRPLAYAGWLVWRASIDPRPMVRKFSPDQQVWS